MIAFTDSYLSERQQLNWYEATLPPRERKQRGHYSTPPLLIEYILDACGYTPEQDLSRIRVLDPACGSGNFLASALHRLVAFGERTRVEHREMCSFVQRNIWGFDPDPVSCFLAEMQLSAVLSSAGASMTLPLHIHQADGLALAWNTGECVDLLLANPPYLAAKNSDLSAYCSTQWRGQADSYLLFLDLALRIVRPGGWIGLVLPDPVLVRANAAGLRYKLLSQTTLHHIWHLSEVFQASVGAVVLIAQKKPPPRHHAILWARAKWRGKIPALQSISQALLHAQPLAQLRYLLSDQQETLLGQLHTHLCDGTEEKTRQIVPLGHLVEIRRGEELAKGTPRLVSKQPEDRALWHPVLRGGIDVRPYCIPAGQHWIARSEIRKPLERYVSPKLLVVKSTDKLLATLDLQGHIVLQTLYLLRLRAQLSPSEQIDELYFLLALLNSRLLRTYVYTLYTAYKWVQPQIEQHVLASLPVPVLETPVKVEIIERAKKLLHACSEKPSVVELKESKELYEEQEYAIEALYHAALQRLQ